MWPGGPNKMKARMSMPLPVRKRAALSKSSRVMLGLMRGSTSGSTVSNPIAISSFTGAIAFANEMQRSSTNRG